MALGIFPCGDLRHVDHGLEPGAPGSVDKIRRRLDDTGANGVAEIGPGGGAGGRPNCIIVLEEVDLVVVYSLST